MGRTASATKRPPGTAASQHTTKHENGVVGPGKKVSKQKSNGHLNGSSSSSSSNNNNTNNKPTEKAPPTPPIPSTPPPINGHTRSVDVPADSKMPTQVLRRASVNDYSESSSSESYHNANANLSPENHRKIDVNAAKNPAVHRDAGPLTFLVTVLRSCPLYDTIAILIVLLQIPPTFLSVVQLLFASLTFVAPSANHHSTFSLTDIFEGALGTPSVATIVAVDLLVLLIWLFLWSPLQDIALDLAQTVIALTLGGGTATKDAGFNNVLVCFGVIALAHFARNGGLRHTGLGHFLPTSASSILGSDPDDPLEIPANAKKGPHGWIRTILAIHILTQGLVRYIRDWYVRRERRDSMLSALGDPEAGKGSSVAHAEEPSAESHAPPSIVTSDLDAVASLPINALTEKALNPKKKRKVSAMVRIRQPLWSALASTKIVMAKEYETSKTAAESAGTNATDVNNLGNAPFDTEADRIWITYVGFDEVFFNTSFFSSYYNEGDAKDEGSDTPGIDRSKPFYVRVNKSVWAPTRVHPVPDERCQSKDNMRWSGEIFGLAPMSSYEIEFISSVDDSVLFVANVRTMQAPTTDAASATLSPSLGQSRPESPTTTLKTSIAAAEAKLTEERNRQKRERKEQKSKMHSTRKDIDKLTSSIATSGGNDDRLRQKVQQSNLHAKQAEDAVTTISNQLNMLDNIPEDECTEWKSAKSAWHAERDSHKATRHEHHERKLKAERELQALQAEVATFQQKRERMQGRISRLNGEYDRITDANAKGLDEAQRKAADRTAKEADRARSEAMYMERLNSLTPQINEMQQTLTSLWANIHAMQQTEFLAQQSQAAQAAAAAAAAAAGQTAQSPTSPNNNNNTNSYDISSDPPTATFPWNTPPQATASSFAPNPYSAISTGPPLNTTANPLAPAFTISSYSPGGSGLRTRGRSSSMLSNVSGFTQSSGEGDLPFYPAPSSTTAAAAMFLPRETQELRSSPAFGNFASINMGALGGAGSSDGTSSSGTGSASGRSPVVGSAGVAAYGQGPGHAPSPTLGTVSGLGIGSSPLQAQAQVQSQTGQHVPARWSGVGSPSGSGFGAGNAGTGWDEN